MHILSLKELESCTGGTLFLKEGSEGISSVVTDNRKVEKDALFIAVKGARTDGHRFIDAAFEGGAACVISENKLEESKGSYILVESSLKALRDIAAYYRTKIKIPVIGIIGSVGKTGTKEMVASVLSQKFKVHKTEGNFNNDIGLPLTLLGIRPYHEVAICEMGISNFGEMDLLGSIGRPDMVVFTNIRECHLEFLHDLDGVLSAKTEVFSHMAKGSHVFFNADDDRIRSIKSDDLVLHGFGTEYGETRGYITEDRGIGGISVSIVTEVGEIRADIDIPGAHNIYHALAGASVGAHMALNAEQISAGICAASSISGRNNIIRLESGITLIDDCYNASPASVNSAIDTLSKAHGRKIAILGDMGELGADEVSIHASIGNNPNFSGVDCLFTVGKLSANITDTLIRRNYKGQTGSFSEKSDLIDMLRGELKSGDVVLVKASHFMGFSEIVDAIKKL